MSAERGLLSGVTVADFGWAIAGPVVARFLAHHGATVIKVESNVRMDPMRMSPPFVGRPSRNRSAMFDQHNAGKLSVTVNLQSAAGRDVARRIAVWAGVVNENFAPGVMARLGLGYEALSRERPDLVMLSSSMQGQTGPHASHPGLGQTLQGLVGLCDLTGWPDREPVGTGEPYTDTLCAWPAGTALVAALDFRQRTGRGTYIDLSQFEAALHFLAPALAHEQLTGAKHSRRGNAGDQCVPEGVYPCAGDERWCAISIESRPQWQALAALLGDELEPGAADEGPDWRRAHSAAIDAAIARWTSARDATDVQDTLQRRGVPAYVVATGADLFENPQLLSRGHFVEREHPSMGPHLYEMPPYRLRQHAVHVGPSPLVGEHTDLVLREYVGMTDAEIEAARAVGGLE